MRNAIVFINICILAGVMMILLDFEKTSSSITPSQDASASVMDIEEISNVSPDDPVSVRDRAASSRETSDREVQYVAGFLDQMVQVRLMETEMAKLAAQRATTRRLKDYGAWMVVHQQEMLENLKQISTELGLEKTSTLNAELSDQLSTLEKLHGKRFDARYIKLMTAEYKRDLKRLERAAYSSDPKIQVFAARYASITKDNLNKIQEIRKATAKIF